jgi:hypothetical protein
VPRGPGTLGAGEEAREKTGCPRTGLGRPRAEPGGLAAPEDKSVAAKEALAGTVSAESGGNAPWLSRHVK